MKYSKKIINLSICFVLLILTFFEAWVAMRFAMGKWGLSAPNKNMLAKFSILLYMLNAIAFLMGIHQNIVYRFFRSLGVSFITALCFYVYLLMGVYV